METSRFIRSASLLVPSSFLFLILVPTRLAVVGCCCGCRDCRTLLFLLCFGHVLGAWEMAEFCVSLLLLAQFWERLATVRERRRKVGIQMELKLKLRRLRSRHNFEADE